MVPFGSKTNLKARRSASQYRLPNWACVPFRTLQAFHLKNRGIIYRCNRFEYDNSKRCLHVTIPDIPPEEFEELENGEPKFGIADGGHTFEVIEQTIARKHELTEIEGWTEPFVRVHFLAGEAFGIGELEQVVTVSQDGLWSLARDNVKVVHGKLTSGCS